MGLEGANPLANALMPGGALTPGQQRGAGVSKDDMQFLQQHVKATEVTHTFARRAGLEGRGLAGVSSVIEGKLPTGTGKAGSALEARYDHTFSRTKRIELPTATRGYRVVDKYTATEQVWGKARDVVQVGTDKGPESKSKLRQFGVTAQYRDDDNVELANATTSISVAKQLAPGEELGLGTSWLAFPVAANGRRWRPRPNG